MSAVILVIDDDLEYLDMMAALLSLSGYGAFTHEGSMNALDTVRQRQPDLIILDLRMEHENAGWEVLGAIRADSSLCQIPIILCSAELNVERKFAEGRIERCVVVRKPFDPAVLLRTIQQMIDQPRLERSVSK